GPRGAGAGTPTSCVAESVRGRPSVMHLLLDEAELQGGDDHQQHEHHRPGGRGETYIGARERLLVDEPAERGGLRGGAAVRNHRDDVEGLEGTDGLGDDEEERGG